MNKEIYLNIFRKVAGQLDKKLLKQLQIEIAVAEVLNCAVIKLYKNTWANPNTDPLTSDSRIFFSVWVSDSAIKEQKILYNIHAFKLRYLAHYAIESKKFATAFRTDFQKEKSKWRNVSTDFGPLTLMEGWIPVDEKEIQHDILELANNFLEIAYLIDNTLLKFKK